MGDVFAEGVVAAESGLDGGELFVGVALEADEDEPGVWLFGVGVDAVGVGVAATENADAAIGLG